MREFTAAAKEAEAYNAQHPGELLKDPVTGQLSFAYSSKIAIQQSGLAVNANPQIGLAPDNSPVGATMVERALSQGGSGVNQEIRSFSGAQGFLAFNPVGQLMQGIFNGEVNLGKSVVALANEVINIQVDQIGRAVTGFHNSMTGDNQIYQNTSAFYRSVDNRGVFGTAAYAASGVVESILAPVQAFINHDWETFGNNIPGLALLGVPGGGFASKAAEFAGGADALSGIAKEAYEIYSPHLPDALESAQNIFGDAAVISGRAKEAGSAANRLQRALDNGWANSIVSPQDAINNLWDALGTRAVVSNPTPEIMNGIVDRIADSIRSGDITVTRVNSLTGEGGISYLTESHLTQLRQAADSVGQDIPAEMVKYDSGYSAGMIYLQYDGGVRGELQILGPRVLDISNAEHIPYDAFLNKPYEGAFPAENLPQASEILDPIREAAQGLNEAQRASYRSYLNQSYINARLSEQLLTTNANTLPDEISRLLDIDNLTRAHNQLSYLK